VNTWNRESGFAWSRRTDDQENCKGTKPEIRKSASPALRKSGCPVEQLLGPSLQVEPGILVRLVAGDGGDALHEIEDALCQAPDYLEELA
jgi:hypothetical protein